MHYGMRCAKKELEFLLASQWESGLIPHTSYGEQSHYAPGPQAWGLADSSGIIQPPVLAIAAYELLTRVDDESLLRKALSQVRRYHAFLREERDPEDTGLIAIFHPWASGTDNSPVYDEALMRSRAELAHLDNAIPLRKDTVYADADERPRDEFYDAYGKLISAIRECEYDQRRLYDKLPFVVQDVLVNTVFVQALLHEARLAEHAHEALGEESFARQAALAREEAQVTIRALRERCFDAEDGLFYAFDVRAGRRIEVPSVHCLLPLWGVASEDQAQRLLEHVDAFWPDAGLTSVASSSPRFEPLRYWRGPVWPVTNYLVARGLRLHDPERAHELTNHTFSLVAEGDDNVVEHAQQVLANNWYERLSCTRPHTGQYPHCWFWDSCFCILGWLRVEQKPAAWDRTGSSFAEYYSPDGTPCGARGMAWSAALCLLCDEKREEKYLSVASR